MKSHRRSIVHFIKYLSPVVISILSICKRKLSFAITFNSLLRKQILSRMTPVIVNRFLMISIFLLTPILNFGQSKRVKPVSTVPIQGTVVTEHFVSEILKDNKIGIELKRSISVYLPPGYHHSKKTYPVIYYFHSINWSRRKSGSTDIGPRHCHRAYPGIYFGGSKL